MTNPDEPAPENEHPAGGEGSHNLDTSYGDESTEVQTGSEDDGPIMPPNHGSGGYAIP